MPPPDAPNGIILFHYAFSPFAKRVVWYLKLRGIQFASCEQPFTLPRDDLAELGIKYRRIPLMSIGRDVYYDTRLILIKLEQMFASSSYPPLSRPQDKGLEALLEKFTVDSGIFMRSAQAIMTKTPAINNEKFLKDREDFTGSSWSKSDMEKLRPEALAHLRHAFDVLEALLSDGRQWIAGTDGISLSDIQAAWPFEWIRDVLDKSAFPQEQHPNTWAWLNRFRSTVKAAEKSVAKPVTLDGKAAMSYIVSAEYYDGTPEVDAEDPLALKEGDLVEIWPIDSGFRHKDKGQLVSLTKDEVAIAIKTKSGGHEIRVHAPRWGFRVVKARAQL